MTIVSTIHRSEQVAQIVQGLLDALTGKGPDTDGLARGVQLRCGTVLLSKIQQDFVTKSEGGTGKDGIAWKPLKKETIANRRLGAGDPRPKNDGKRPYLTESQDRAWRRLFATRKAWLMGKFGLGESEAKTQAAAQAWAEIKRQGGKTKLEVLGNRQVAIGRDTSRMFASFSPGVASDDQVLRADPGAIVVGSNVEYAGAFHKERPFWPRDGRLPEDWTTALQGTARRGLVEALQILIERGP